MKYGIQPENCRVAPVTNDELNDSSERVNEYPMSRYTEFDLQLFVGDESCISDGGAPTAR